MQLIEVNRKRTIKSFHQLPFKLYKNNKVWVAHLRQDIESVFDKNKNSRDGKFPSSTGIFSN